MLGWVGRCLWDEMNCSPLLLFGDGKEDRDSIVHSIPCPMVEKTESYHDPDGRTCFPHSFLNPRWLPHRSTTRENEQVLLVHLFPILRQYNTQCMEETTGHSLQALLDMKIRCFFLPYPPSKCETLSSTHDIDWNVLARWVSRFIWAFYLLPVSTSHV